MARVETVLNAAHARITARDKKENHEVWTVEGLVHPGLRRTLFTFRDGVLIEVELQYEYEGRGVEWFNDRMGEIRRYFDGKYGTGKLVSRSRDTDTDVVQTLVDSRLREYFQSGQTGGSTDRVAVEGAAGPG